jgi:acyl-coenzyme A thioesterase PaaI-like protein
VHPRELAECPDTSRATPSELNRLLNPGFEEVIVDVTPEEVGITAAAGRRHDRLGGLIHEHTIVA